MAFGALVVLMMWFLQWAFLPRSACRDWSAELPVFGPFVGAARAWWQLHVTFHQEAKVLSDTLGVSMYVPGFRDALVASSGAAGSLALQRVVGHWA